MLLSTIGDCRIAGAAAGADDLQAATAHRGACRRPGQAQRSELADPDRLRPALNYRIACQTIYGLVPALRYRRTDRAAANFLQPAADGRPARSAAGVNLLAAAGADHSV